MSILRISTPKERKLNSQNNLTNDNTVKTKNFLTISPALPCLPAIPKRHKLQHRSNSTLSLGEADLPPCTRVNLTVGPDGTIQAYRSQKEKEKHPERVHLDRRGLTTIPLFIDEGQLRFLSFQHNLLTKLDNLSSPKLNCLVFLDLYDNQLENMAGINSLENLKVLLMGKNKIRQIEGLSNLQKLEVLDLHGNQVNEIAGVNSLNGLKVLNLAGNLIRNLKVADLTGLHSLQELNLRRNKIKNLNCFTENSQLAKLYLSNNDIQSIDDLQNVALATSLKEITIDGNPVALSNECMSFLVSHLPQLQLLSNMQVTDNMKISSAAWKLNKYGLDGCKAEQSETSPPRASPQLVSKTEKKMYEKETEGNDPLKLPRLQNVGNESPNLVEKPDENVKDDTIDNGRASVSNKQSQLNKHLKSKCPNKFREEGGDYLIEINGRILCVFGLGSLRFIDRPWNPVKAGDVSTVKFSFINFNSIASVLGKIKSRFPNSEHFHFHETNIYCLGQLNALADIQGLTSLTIEEAGNPICEKKWRNYAIYRLSHWGLKTINDFQITEAELAESETDYGGLSELVLTSMPESFFEPILEKLNLEQSVSEPREWLETAEPAVRSVVAKEALQWKKFKQEDSSARNKGLAYLKSVIEFTVSCIFKLHTLQEEWPSIFHELVRDTLVDYSHLDSYMKECMSKIK